MGKRSDFERISRDFYRTPTEAVLPLRPFFGAGRHSASHVRGTAHWLGL
jgi:hypothetical protein